MIQQELEIKLGELQEKWHFSSLEKIFIENRIYRDIEECETWEAVIAAIDKGLKPHVKKLYRKVTEEDIVRLTEIRIKRISKFDSFKADELIKGLEDAITEVEKNLKNLTRYTISYYNNLKKKFGKGRERRTELSEFAKLDRTQVVMSNETLYLNAKEGFAGFGKSLSKDEVIGKCSTLDDIVTFTPEGTVKVMRVADKLFVGKRPLHLLYSVRMKKKCTPWCIEMDVMARSSQNASRWEGSPEIRNTPSLKAPEGAESSTLPFMILRRKAPLTA